MEKLSIFKKLSLLTVVLLVSANMIFAGGENRIFKAVEDEQISANVDDSMYIRSRLVKIKKDFITESGPETMEINLFPDVTLTANLKRIEHVASDSTSWIGKVEGYELSDVVIVRKGDIYVGTVNLGSELYQLRYVQGELHVVGEMRHFENVDDAVEVPREAIPALDSEVPPVDGDNGKLITVLIVYTTAAKNAAGGSAAIKAEIDQAISLANTGFNNSGIDLQFALAHHQEVTYSETNFDFSTALSRLQGKNDGYMDNVHSIRATYNADVVVLLCQHSSNTLGIGYVMQQVGNYFKDWSFSVVARVAISGFTVHHEIGHNMGCAHDRANASVTGAYSYSYGYQATDRSFRTVMAYNCVGGCPRVNYFSNPNVNYNGQPTGIVHTAGDAADNSRSLGNTKMTTANFFQTSNVPPSFNTIYGTVSVREGQSINLDFSATDLNGDAITYGNTAVPAGATMNTSSAQFNWTPSYTQGGRSFTFTVTASDGKSAASQSVTISVTNVKKIIK